MVKKILHRSVHFRAVKSAGSWIFWAIRWKNFNGDLNLGAITSLATVLGAVIMVDHLGISISAIGHLGTPLNFGAITSLTTVFGAVF